MSFRRRRLYPVQSSTLSAGSLATDLSRLYPLGRSVDCVFYRKGICDTYHVCARNARFFLKVYRHGRRSRLDVEEEVRLLLHLAHDDVSVAAPVPRNDNAFVTAFDAPEGTRFAVLFDAAKGELDAGGDLTRVTALGRMVGRMHRSLDSFPLPYRRQKLDLAHLIDENMEAIGQIMSHRKQDLRLIGSVGDEIKRLSLFSTTMAPEFGPCHGDLHGGDVAYDSDGKPTVFDFDSSGCGWRAYDIGVFPASVQWMDVSEATEKAPFGERHTSQPSS